MVCVCFVNVALFCPTPPLLRPSSFTSSRLFPTLDNHGWRQEVAASNISCNIADAETKTNNMTEGRLNAVYWQMGIVPARDTQLHAGRVEAAKAAKVAKAAEADKAAKAKAKAGAQAESEEATSNALARAEAAESALAEAREMASKMQKDMDALRDSAQTMMEARIASAELHAGRAEAAFAHMQDQLRALLSQ